LTLSSASGKEGNCNYLDSTIFFFLKPLNLWLPVSPKLMQQLYFIGVFVNIGFKTQGSHHLDGSSL
jgi:hypothetical protein